MIKTNWAHHIVSYWELVKKEKYWHVCGVFYFKNFKISLLRSLLPCLEVGRWGLEILLANMGTACVLGCLQPGLQGCTGIVVDKEGQAGRSLLQTRGSSFSVAVSCVVLNRSWVSDVFGETEVLCRLSCHLKTYIRSDRERKRHSMIHFVVSFFCCIVQIKKIVVSKSKGHLTQHACTVKA